MSSHISPPSIQEKDLEKDQEPQVTQQTPSRASTPTVASREDENDADSVNAEFERETFGPEPGEKGWDKYEVRITPDDPDSPFRMSRVRRWYITMLGGILVLNATFASSTPSGIVPEMMEYFGFGREVATLTISLFVAGYCVGPLFWGPLSETYGRKPVLFVSFVIYTAFQIGCALSKNTASIIIFRFLGGCFAASPLVVSGALIGDIWDPNTRGKALAFFTLGPFAGPALGPIASGFMSVSGVSWRWTYWLMTIFAGVCSILIFFTLPETYTPILVVKRAQKLRKETGDQNYWAPLERKKLTIVQRLEEVVARPFKVLFAEPMLMALSLFMSFVYGCIYLLFEAFPIVFSIGHGFNAGILGLMFLPLFLGGCLGVVGYLVIWNPKYERLAKECAPHPVPPEARLEQALWAGPAFAISFFWFGWTSYPSISFWAPMMSSVFLGFSVVWIFLGIFNYIIDCYLYVAASALAINAVMRSSFGASFPLFATQMYESLNPRWASTLVGLIACLLVPIPFVLIKYGPALRHKSKYAPTKPIPPKPVKSEEESV
ncbi:MFS general substrate transporter [Irpex rosettiformis]|uniref:MFS general substrate transporter n=1 Tax=Irpex rosettiformis TaxID=378272 RepID=A0ACB8UL71_9APHY|nr:MFS general substrate transporter [Irpex rosettiformis]